MGAGFAFTEHNAVPVLGCDGKGRLPAVLHPAAVLPLLHPLRRHDCPAAEVDPGIVALAVGDPGIVLRFHAAGGFGEPGPLVQINEIKPGFAAPAPGLGSHGDADPGRVVDPLALHPPYKLDKSFATACGDRKYLGSASGSRMSSSDNIHSLTILWGAEIL